MFQYIKLRFVIAGFLFLNFSLFGQQNHLGILGENNKVVIPFEYREGFILVDVMFHHVFPLKFIFDTGAGHTILLKKKYADILKIPYQKRVRLMGSDMSEDIFAHISRNIPLQVMNTTVAKQDIVVLENDVLLLDEFIGTKVDGILGIEFFRDFIIQIDYNKQLLVLYNPDSFNPKLVKGFETLDLEIYQYKPYLNTFIEISKGNMLTTKLLIDTGAALSLLLHHNTDTLMVLPETIIAGNIGKGLGGEIDGYRGKIDQLALGKVNMYNIIVSFQDLEHVTLEQEKIVRNGIIGNLLLERFTTFIDLNSNKLYLKPNKKFDRPFEFDKSGIVVYAFGNNLQQYYVKNVIENSPAAKVDIRPGDIIIKMNHWSTKLFSLNFINRKLAGKSGNKIKLTLIRDGKRIKKSFYLKDFLEK